MNTLTHAFFRAGFRRHGAAWLLAMLLLGGCQGAVSRSGDAPDRSAPLATYDLDAPDTLFRLPDPLREISGLAWEGPGRLLAHNDEDGILIRLDAGRGTVLGQWRFGDDRDYEGVACLGAEAWLVESDGDLFRVSGYDGPSPRVTKYEHALSRDQDVEGLAWDGARRLLLACKDEPGAGLDRDDHKALYAFDPERGVLDEQPAVRIGLEEVATRLRRDVLHGLGPELQAAFKLKGKRRDLFQPSGVAVHPQTGRLWVLSAHYRMLAVLDPDGRLRALHALSHPAFPQPEGLCFDPRGVLYLSSEANNGPSAVLGRFLRERK